jgi:hypothetical protein
MSDLPFIPVRSGDNGEIRDAEGRLMGHIYGHRQSGRLDFFVRTINRAPLFEELVEALESLLTASGQTKHWAAQDRARAVLAKAREAGK